MKSFPFPMKKHEAVFGWMYVFIHAALLAPALRWVITTLFTDSDITDAGMNVIYYGIGLVLIFTVMFSFMRESFSDLCDNFKNTLTAILLGYIFYIAATKLVSLGLGFILEDITDPNSANIQEVTKLNPNAIIVVSVLFAPIVEEVLFRGTVFGTLRKKNRILAYAVSALLFAFYHLWEFFFYSYHWTLFLYVIRYIPAGLVLAWSYEKGKNIWSPIFLHMMINLISIKVTIG